VTPPGLSAKPRNAKSPSPSLSPAAKASSQRPMRRHQARSAEPQRVLADRLGEANEGRTKQANEASA